MIVQHERALLGAVEAGGTKINLAVGYSPTEILATTQLPTKQPEITIPDILKFFEAYQDRLQGFGVASFGPVRLDRSAPDWGNLLTTPKRDWIGQSFATPLVSAFGLPVELDTDVSAAALAEHRLGALRDAETGVYLTVGTGIGAGLLAHGRPIHGEMHPEFGHVRIIRTLKGDDSFSGCCPYHGDCLEGIAAGPAITKRWGCPLNELPNDHIAHTLVADYLGQACATLALTFATGRIVIGGGVSKTPGLHAAIEDRVHHWLGGYLPERQAPTGSFIVPPKLGDHAGLIGALILAGNSVSE